MAVETVQNLPNPTRVVEALRQMGYSLRGAIADLVDNSITAGASLIEIDMGLNPLNQPFFSIRDDGTGMDRDGLINALKYGSDSQTNPKSLSKFGMGLKTASTTFSNRVTLISRPKGSDIVMKASLDIDYIRENNDWLTQLDDQPSAQEIEDLDYVAKGQSGTCVVWDKIINMITVTDQYGNPSTAAGIKQKMTRSQGDIRTHLAMTFQRFVDPEDTRARNVTIRLNGNDIEPWDPFRSHLANVQTASQSFHVIESSDTPGEPDKEYSFSITWHILPRPEEFENDVERRLSHIGSNTNATNYQGIYTYRENRLVSEPNWFNIWAREPHANLLRVDLSFDHQMDDQFGISVDKSKINIDIKREEIRQQIVKFLTPIRREAVAINRKGNKKVFTESNIHATSIKVIDTNVKSGQLIGPQVKSIDQENSVVNLINNYGETQLKMTIDNNADSTHLLRVDTLDDAVLWEPGIINNTPGVRINTSHPYYEKTWQTHEDDSPIIQALDYLIYALATAENNNVYQELEDVYKEFRIDVSRSLRKLVEHLPEPVID